MAPKSANKKSINLALQGGGAHGAYTWGVLDRLLEEEDIRINAISGSSAGAMNAAMLASGYRHNDRAGAKAKLAEFWTGVSAMGAWASPIHANPIKEFQHQWNLDDQPSYQMFDVMSRVFSPYQLNPFNLNPLGDLLRRILDIKIINKGGDIPIFVTATNVHTGQPRIFKCQEITVDALLASACIPFYFQSVVINDEPYWDGGYMGNPSIWPLIYNTHVHDVLLVQINPIYRETTPKTANDIINRLNEITFNASLIAEMRAINFATRLIRQGKLNSDNYKDIHMHMIHAPDATDGLNASSKMNTDWAFFEYLRDAGRSAMQEWIEKNKKFIGVQTTIDIGDEFLGMNHMHTAPVPESPVAKTKPAGDPPKAVSKPPTKTARKTSYKKPTKTTKKIRRAS